MVFGLKYLHDNKIIHRDLKPENILFSARNYKLPVKIGDFILHTSDSYTGNSTGFRGTSRYMAPEAYIHQFSFPADIYSLGLIIGDVFKLIPFSEEHFVSEIDGMEDIRKLIFNMTKKEAMERTQSLYEVMKVFDDLQLSSNSIANEVLGSSRNSRRLSSTVYYTPKAPPSLVFDSRLESYLGNGAFGIVLKAWSKVS